MADLNPGDKRITSNNKPMWGFLRRNLHHKHHAQLKVHDIPKHIETKEQLEAVFAPHAYVRNSNFVITTQGEQSPLAAYVDFETKEDLRKGITIANGTNSPFIQLNEIPKDMSERDLRRCFQNCGEIENIRIGGDHDMTSYSVTRKAIVIFRREDDANGAVTHLCNVGLGNLPFRIDGLITQTEYQVPPNAVYDAAKSQQNLGLNEIIMKQYPGRFAAKKNPPLGAAPPSVPGHAAALHTGQRNAGAIQRQPPPLPAGPNQQQQGQIQQQQGHQQPLQPRPYPPDLNASTFQQRSSPQRQVPPPSAEDVTNIAPAPAHLHANPNQQQQHRNQQPVQRMPYQLPPTATAPAEPYQQTQQLGPYPLPGAQAGQNQPHMFPLAIAATQVQGYNAPTLQQQRQQLQIPLHGNRLPAQPVTHQSPTPVPVRPNLQPQQQLAAAFQWQPQPVHRVQYPIAVPVFYAAPIPQQLAPPGRFTLLVREIPYYFKDTDVLEIFQRYSYSGSLIEAKVQLCTQALTQPHATVTYGLRNDADQAIQNLHLKYLQRSPTDPTPIIFTVEPYDY